MAKKSRTISTKQDGPSGPSTTSSCVDLFCGAGGLTHGLIDGGSTRRRRGVDFDEACKHPYTANHEGIAFHRARRREAERI